MTWIPCDERIPDAEVPVLIRAHNGTVTVAQRIKWKHLTTVDWAPVGWWSGGVGDCDWDESGLYGGVTHWMPLPDQPNG